MERGSNLAAMALLFAVVGPADAQATPGPAIRSLSPADQNVARALFEAQVPAPLLTLQQIGARRQRAKSWSEVFEQMKSRRLVAERSLSELLRQYNARHHADLGAGAAGRTR